MIKPMKKNILKVKYRLLSDSVVIKMKFKKYLGYELDLENPKTFNEKIQWLKLYDRSDIHTVTADKFLSRKRIIR